MSLVLQSHDQLSLRHLPVLRVGAPLPLLALWRRPLAVGRRLHLLQLPLRLPQLHLQLLVLPDEVVVLDSYSVMS